MPRLLWLHGQFIPARKYQETLLLPLLSNLPDNKWEVTYLQSPRPCADPPPDIIGRMFPDIQPGEMAEWINSQAKSDGSKEYLGLPESLAFLQNYLRDQPRFDVIAGHSNGALVTSVLALYMEREDDSWDLPKEKHPAGIACFNAPNSYETETTLAPLVNDGKPMIQMPSIHVFGGPTDHTYEGSQKLARIHHHPSSCRTMEHSAGHWFPTDKDNPVYPAIVKALQDMVSK